MTEQEQNELEKKCLEEVKELIPPQSRAIDGFSIMQDIAGAIGARHMYIEKIVIEIEPGAVPHYYLKTQLPVKSWNKLVECVKGIEVADDCSIMVTPHEDEPVCICGHGRERHTGIKNRLGPGNHSCVLCDATGSSCSHFQEQKQP